MKVSEIILKQLDKQKISQLWLADKINMSKSTLSYKLKNDTVTADEMITISKILNIDLNKIKEEV